MGRAVKKTVIVALTICFDTLYGNAAERETAKYYDLTEWGCDHQVNLSTLEVALEGAVITK